MKVFLAPTTVVFTPGIVGTGQVVADIANFDIRRLVAIINQTRGILLYSTASATLKYNGIVTGANSGIKFGIDTTGQSSADVIQFIYEDPAALKVSLSTPTAGNVLAGFQNFGTAIQRLTVAGTTPSITRKRLSFFIQATTLGTEQYFLTNFGGSFGNGIPLFPGQLYPFENDAGDYYIVSDTATQKVFILEQV